MGLNLDSTFESRLLFLKSGWTTACFRAVGKQPDIREALTICTIHGPIQSKAPINKRLGIMSDGHEEEALTV